MTQKAHQLSLRASSGSCNSEMHERETSCGLRTVLRQCRSLALLLAFAGVIALLTVRCSPPAVAMAGIVVAADGSGDFKTVQEAVDAVPANNRTRTVIRIKPGTYKARVIVPSNKPRVTFQGEDAATTILTYDLANPPEWQVERANIGTDYFSKAGLR